MRERPPQPDQLPWHTDHDLRFSDIDRQGHISNGIFDRLMESSRVLLMDRVMAASGHRDTIVLGRVEIDFLGEMHWPGKVVAAVGVERLGSSSITLRQALFMEGTGKAACRSIVVSIDPDSRRPRPMSEELRAELAVWKLK